MKIRDLEYDELVQFLNIENMNTSMERLNNKDSESYLQKGESLESTMNLEQRLLILQDIHLHRGYIIGAFEMDELIGLAALDSQYISGFRLRLVELIVRENKEQIKDELLTYLKNYAKDKEVESLYLCIENNKKEIDYYVQRGASIPQRHDSYLQQLYSSSVHLELAL